VAVHWEHVRSVKQSDKTNIMGVVNKSLQRMFRWLGGHVGKYPNHYVFVPLVICAVSCLGALRFQFENDFEYLFTPTTGFSWVEKEFANKYFPANESGQFDVSRKIDIGRFVRYY